MLWLLVSVSIGAAVGAALGHFGRCSTGGCVMFANRTRGMLVGAAYGMLYGLGGMHS